jgi:hypothetical protein
VTARCAETGDGPRFVELAVVRGADTTVVMACLCAFAFVCAMPVPANAEDVDITDERDAIADASLRAVLNREVRLDVAEGFMHGKLLAFEDDTVTIAIAATREVITIDRDRVVRVIAIDPATKDLARAIAVPDKRRFVGVQFSLLGTVAVDVDYKNFHAFASTNLLFPILTAGGSGTWLTGAVGAGASWPLGDTGRWRLDVFGHVAPLRTTSYYTYLGVGVGAGFHYTARSGFTLGFTLPIVGFASRFGTSTYGYDASFRYNDSVAYYYFAGISGMPIVTMGYRFGCGR